MPHLAARRIAELTTKPHLANCEGDWNALYFMQYLREFLSVPRYKTIALIRKASMNTQVLGGVDQIEDILRAKGVEFTDRAVARDLAFREFYDLVGRTYENQAMVKNGVMPLLKEVQAVLFPQAGFEVNKNV